MCVLARACVRGYVESQANSDVYDGIPQVLFDVMAFSCDRLQGQAEARSMGARTKQVLSETRAGIAHGKKRFLQTCAAQDDVRSLKQRIEHAERLKANCESALVPAESRLVEVEELTQPEPTASGSRREDGLEDTEEELTPEGGGRGRGKGRGGPPAEVN